MSICCCSNDIIEAYVAIGVTMLITGVFWSSVVFAPIKLVAVLLHEASHAGATLMTCGKVTGIEINEYFGGMCYSRGGYRPLILSAGYTGSVFWGSYFLLSTSSNISTRIAAVVFIIACVLTAIILKITDRACCGCKCAFGMGMRLAILCLAAVPAAFWAWEDNATLQWHPLRWCMLVIGTVCIMHAVYDCFHDVLLKKIDNEWQGKSDAVMFAEEFGGTARCWGLLWSAVAAGFVTLALFLLTLIHSNCALASPTGEPVVEDAVKNLALAWV